MESKDDDADISEYEDYDICRFDYIDEQESASSAVEQPMPMEPDWADIDAAAPVHTAHSVLTKRGLVKKAKMVGVLAALPEDLFTILAIPGVFPRTSKQFNLLSVPNLAAMLISIYTQLVHL